MSVEADVSQGTTPEPSVGWGERLALALLRLVVIVIVEALLGLLVGGVGGRLAMLLLAVLTPEATGVTSDDGFAMGQFTASGTLSLLAAGTFLGAVGGVLYALLRGLMIGPRWFQVLSVGGGPAVVVGSMLRPHRRRRLPAPAACLVGDRTVRGDTGGVHRPADACGGTPAPGGRSPVDATGG